jgi:hypothetical protein
VSEENARVSLGEAVQKHTAHPSGGEPFEPDDIVVVVPGGDLPAAFACAEELVRSGRSVRVIGHGATLPATWPSWVYEQRVSVSELGAYRAANPFDATADMRDSYRRWIDAVFASAAPPGAAADIYYAPVVLRLFHASFESRIFAGGIATLHARSRVHLVGKDKVALEDVLGLHAPSLESRAREAALPAVLLAAWVAASAVTLMECVRMRADARASLDAIASQEGQRAEPALWTGMVPDWDRMNKHLIDAVSPLLGAARPLGIVLTGTLRGGMRAEQDLKKVSKREELWPGLGRLRADLRSCVVEQAVQPRGTVAFARATLKSLGASASVATRMALRSSPLRALVRDGGLVRVAKQAAAAASLDVARSVLAEQAAREVVERHDFSGRVVAFNAVNAAGYTSVEWVFRHAGATTVEHTHGSGGNEFYGGSESSAEYQCIWTQPESEAFAADRKLLLGGMPEVMKLRSRVPTVPRRVLLLSNYVHRDRLHAAAPFEPFQDELLRVPALLRAKFGDDLEFRWRPHPADEDAAIARGHARVPFVVLSRGRSLAQDLDDCDVLISTQSTALVEAVVGDVPFFAHLIPGAGLTWVPPERLFFHADELVPRFTEWVEALRREDPQADEPTRRARRALFGDTGHPRSLLEGIASLASGPQIR